MGKQFVPRLRTVTVISTPSNSVQQIPGIYEHSGVKIRSGRRTRRYAFKRVQIYTVGVCYSEPGPGSYGVILEYQGHRSEKKARYGGTTKVQMSLLAAIAGLKALNQRCDVTVVSDCDYLLRVFGENKLQSECAKQKKDGVLHPELIERLVQLCYRHRVRFRSFSGNERGFKQKCLELANDRTIAQLVSLDTEYRDSTSYWAGFGRQRVATRSDGRSRRKPVSSYVRQSRVKPLSFYDRESRQKPKQYSQRSHTPIGKTRLSTYRILGSNKHVTGNIRTRSRFDKNVRWQY